MTGRAVACSIFDNLINVHVINERLPQAIHYNGEICVCVTRLVVIPTTMKLCMRAMPTITISIHELQICKQQQIASGTKSCISILLMLITLLC